MSNAIPAALQRLFRERRAILWICQRYDLVEGETPHDYDLPAADAALKYRATPSDADLRLGKLYWEAVWLEGARSPILTSSREAAKNGPAKTRPIVVLSSEWDARAEVSFEEFLPIFVLPGLLDDSTPRDAQYGTFKRRQRERIAWELSRKITLFPRRALVVIGAETQDDLKQLYEVLEDQPTELHVLLVWPRTQPVPSPPQSPLVDMQVWLGSPQEFVAALEEAGVPTAEQVPEWAIRVSGKTVTLTVNEVAGVVKRFALLTEGQIGEPNQFGMEDLEDFLNGSLDNWAAFGIGLPIPRSYTTAQGADLLKEVSSTLKQLDSEEARRLTCVIQLPSAGGSGATTSLRDVAFKSAKNGYPTLILKPDQVDVDLEDLSSFGIALSRAAQSAGIIDMPPMLVVLDVEHSRFVRTRDIAQRLAVEGRKALILQAIPSSNDSEEEKRGQRWIRLRPFKAEAAEEEVQACIRELRAISRHWNLPIDIPDEAQWRNYESASRWHSSAEPEESTQLFWVGLRYFLTAGMDFTTAERARDALGKWIERRSARIAEPGMRELVNYVAALSSARILSPLTTVLRPVTGGVFGSELLQTLRELSDLVTWGEFAQDLGDQILRFIHPALAEEYLRQQGVGTRQQQILILKPLLSSLSVGNPADVWVAEAVASELVPGFSERKEVDWDWRLNVFNSIPPALRDSSKAILHHWARCLYQSAESRRDGELAVDERRIRLLGAIEKLKKAIELPRRIGRDEHPSHLYNTLGTAWSRYARFLRTVAGGANDADAWNQACKAFTESLAISNGSNIDALLAFATRLVDHATSLFEAGDQSRALNDLAQALSLLDQTDDLIEQFDTPDANQFDDLVRIRSDALSQLDEKASEQYLETLKNSDDAELGYYCEARQALRLDGNELGTKRALDILDEAESRGVSLSYRSVALRLSLITKDPDGRFDFARLSKLYEQLRSKPGYTPRTLDMFRYAVICYQLGNYPRGAEEFRRLREQARRVGAVPLRVRDFWRDSTDPNNPRRANLRVLRVLSDWRGEGVVEELNQSVPIRPRHFRPPLKEREIRECIVRFEFNGPLAVPVVFSGDQPRERFRQS